MLEIWRKVQRRGTIYTERQKEEIQERGRRKIVEDHDCGGRLIHKRERDGLARSLRFKLGLAGSRRTGFVGSYTCR